MTTSSRSEALIKTQDKYEKTRKDKVRLPGSRLNDDEAEVLNIAVSLHGGSGKDTILDALKLLIKKLK